ncbi:hypothetical protein SHIRM173S_03785 [Streptomyces hirsutus]
MRAGRGGQGLARVAVVVRAGAAPLWWLGVCAAGIGVLVPGLTGRRIGVSAGAALFLVALAVVAYARRGRYRELARPRCGPVSTTCSRTGRSACAPGAAGTAAWLLAFLAALGGAFVIPAAGGLLLAGCGVGLWLKASCDRPPEEAARGPAVGPRPRRDPSPASCCRLLFQCSCPCPYPCRRPCLEPSTVRLSAPSRTACIDWLIQTRRCEYL